MPSLGADMEDGTLVEWLIAEGDVVARGDVVAVVETQKGAIEIECFETGPVSKLLVRVGQLVPVGAPLALIGETAVTEASPEPEPEPVARPDATPAPEAAPVAPPDPVAAAPVASPPATRPVQEETIAFIPPTSEQPRATPAARLRARDLGIDLSGVAGTGPGGVIVLGDVDRAPATDRPDVPPADAPATRTDPRAEMRKAIAAAMARSNQTIPHFYLSQTIDFQPAMDDLATLNADRAPADRVLASALLLRAAARAAKACPTLNGHFTDDAFHPAEEVHAGLVIALRGGGLVAPAIMDADTLTLDQAMAAMRDVVSRARAGRLRGSEMTGGTITVSSLGDSGAEAMGGIIFPPQVALVGSGAPQVRPWVVDGTVQPRQVITVTLAVDHRVNDGRQASRFLAAFETHLTSPEAS